MSKEYQIPIQPVENPILCSPYKEPDQHWLYNTQTGVPSKTPNRRPASYWFKSERTGSAQMSLLAEEERDDLPLVNALRDDVKRWRESGWENASETTKKLLRHWWREDRTRRLFFCQIEAVETIIYLREILAQGKKPRWTPKLALEEFNTLSEGQNPRPHEWITKVAQHPKLADIPNANDHRLKPISRYACKMATGSGKTVVMAMLISWAFCNRGTKPGDPRFPRRSLIVCPNLTIKERLAVLRPDDPDNYYEKFDLVPTTLRGELAKGKVFVTNWHWFSPESEVIKVGGVTVGKLGAETPEAFTQNRLGDLWDTEPLMVLNDEGHHAYRPAQVGENEKLTPDEKADREEATVWVSGLDKINSACGISLSVDMSATPFYIHGSGYPEGSPFPWIVSDFSLVDAIESGITKIPRLPAIDNTGQPDPKYFKLWEHITRDLKAGEKFTGGKVKPEVVYRKAEDALLTLAGEWKERFDLLQNSTPGQDRTPPVMIIVCDNTDIAEHFHRMISGEETIEADAPEDDEEDSPKRKKKAKPQKTYSTGLKGFPQLWNHKGAEVSLRIDSELLKAAENDDPKATRKEVAEELRKIVSTVGKPGELGERIRCVVSVNMLSEGWDANNVTHILGLRAFHSQLLCEQVVGRGLRRMDYTPDPKTGLLSAEYVDIFGVPFSLIPFKGREPGGGTPPEDRPKHEIIALPGRKQFEIRFPVVEGYVVDLKRNLIHCDVSQVERTGLDPWNTPTAAFIRPQVGYQVGHPSAHGSFGFTEVNRHEYYDSVHPQTIAFEIAREIVRELTVAAHTGKKALKHQGRGILYPQVLKIVEGYIATRVEYSGCHPCEIGLQTYAQRIISLLVAAITPDDAKGETPLLPRLNRYKPTGSTENVHFKTVKPVVVTQASHLNLVACDTNSWEQAAVFQLEKLAQKGVVICYARNDRLEFNIPYELYGNPQVYEPDFLVKLASGVTLILEIKGQTHPDTDAKHQAARRWLAAVNHWGRLGKWDFLVCRNPQHLARNIEARD
jgi:type III restriction enzyme